MSLWLDAIKAASSGDSARARELLNELISGLRYPRQSRSENDCAYDGPVAKAVLHAISGFGEGDRRLAENRSEDLIDYIVELIEKKIFRTIALVAYCNSYPEKNLDEIVRDFGGLRGLKRNPDQLRQFVELRLRSMIAEGVFELTKSVAIEQVKLVDIENEKLLGFDERNLIKSMPMIEKWIDFKRREKLSYDHESFDLLNENAASEAADFGGISSKLSDFPLGRDWEFVQLAQQISQELNDILIDLHNNKVKSGFRPIAFHRVWWQYDRDGYLELECISPECATDDGLAEYISGTYPEVSRMNRLIAQRRRTKLENACKDRVMEIYQSYGRPS